MTDFVNVFKPNENKVEKKATLLLLTLVTEVHKYVISDTILLMCIYDKTFG